MDERLRQGIHTLEKKALILDRQAVLELVSLERTLLAAALTLLEVRKPDGTAEIKDMAEFETAVSMAVMHHGYNVE